ncbi:MAG: hypothetical protein WCV41_01315 [Patescibacteria group bacterium]
MDTEDIKMYTASGFGVRAHIKDNVLTIGTNDDNNIFLLGSSCQTEIKKYQRGMHYYFTDISFYLPTDATKVIIAIVVANNNSPYDRKGYIIPIEKKDSLWSAKIDDIFQSEVGKDCGIFEYDLHEKWGINVMIKGKWYSSALFATEGSIDGDTLCKYLAGVITVDEALVAADKCRKEAWENCKL